MSALEHKELRLINSCLEIKHFLTELADAIHLVAQDLEAHEDAIYADLDGNIESINEDLAYIRANVLILDGLTRSIEFVDVPNIKELYSEVKKELKGTKQNG